MLEKALPPIKAIYGYPYLSRECGYDSATIVYGKAGGSQQLVVTLTDTAHGSVIISGSGVGLVGAQHTLAPFIPPAPLRNSFQDRYQLVCSQTGEPLASYPYAIRRASGAGACLFGGT